MSRVVGWFLIGLLAGLGCATSGPKDRAPKPGNGIAEYRQIVEEALKAMDATLSSLQRVRAETNACPKRVFAKFSKQVEQLRADSVQVRARAQAIEARGDAYFQRWHENLALIEDPGFRKAVEEHRPQLEESFGKIKLTLQQTRDVFKPFLNGLRKLRISLENDLTAVKKASTKDLMQTTAENGQRVKEGLLSVREELRTMSGFLSPRKYATRENN